MKKQLTDKEILEKYRNAFQQFSKDGIIDLDKQLGVKFFCQIHRLEHVVPKLNGVIPPNRQSMYYIFLYKGCAARKSVGTLTFPIRDNMIVVIPQRTIHSTFYECLQCSGYVLNFNVDFFLHQAFPRKYIVNKKVFKVSLRPWLILSHAQQIALESIFEQIIQENDSVLMEKDQMIALKILELLIRCDRFFSEAEGLGKEPIFNPILEKFNVLIEQYFSRERAVNFYAGELNIKPEYLNKLLKKHQRSNAKKTIEARLLLEAQVLLATDTYPIKEISRRLGFSKSKYFTNFFTRNANMSPTRYRVTVMTTRAVKEK